MQRGLIFSTFTDCEPHSQCQLLCNLSSSDTLSGDMWSQLRTHIFIWNSVLVCILIENFMYENRIQRSDCGTSCTAPATHQELNTHALIPPSIPPSHTYTPSCCPPSLYFYSHLPPLYTPSSPYTHTTSLFTGTDLIFPIPRFILFQEEEQHIHTSGGRPSYASTHEPIFYCRIISHWRTTARLPPLLPINIASIIGSQFFFP